MSPQTGPLAPFGEADNFMLSQIRDAAQGRLDLGGTKYAVEILVKDVQSNPNRAGEVAADLILKDKIDLMLVASTPETTNPVSDQCELNGVPCVSSLAPWQPWFFGRKGDPAKGFDWTYHFFWGLEDVIAVFTNMWKSLPTNKTVGGLFPNDGDGNAWGDKERGFPKPLAAEGFTLFDPGRYQNLTQDFSRADRRLQARQRRHHHRCGHSAGHEDVLDPGQAAGLKPKVVSVGKALLFPGAVEAMGDLGDGFSTEVWWTPSYPVYLVADQSRARSSLRRPTRRRPRSNGRSRIGFGHALFEVGIDALKRSKDVTSPAAIRDAIAATNLNTVVGPIAWGKGSGQERVQDAAGGRPMGEGQEVQVRAGHRQQPDRAQHPHRRRAQADALNGTGSGSSRAA